MINRNENHFLTFYICKTMKLIFYFFQNHVNKLLPVFEIFLQDAPSTASYDAVRQSVVILMGSLAKHLEKDDPKVKPIVAKLIETLATPSQQVCCSHNVFYCYIYVNHTFGTSQSKTIFTLLYSFHIH